MGIGDKSILAVGKDIKSTTEDMVAEMVDEESAIICIYYGEEVTEEDANALGAAYNPLEKQGVYPQRYILQVFAIFFQFLVQLHSIPEWVHFCP